MSTRTDRSPDFHDDPNGSFLANGGGSLEGVERGSADHSADLEERVSTLKQEVDALQIHVMEGAKRWYRQLPVLIPLVVSVLALGFSFWTDYKAEARLNREEAHEARVELRGVLQRLQALPKENFEIFRTYQDDAVAQRSLSPLLNTENLVLARQAAELIKELDGDVTATEYYATAYAFYTSDQPTEAGRLLSEGLKVVDDPINETGLLRQDAIVRFYTGDIEGGRERWQQALDVFGNYPEQSKALVAATHLQTEMSWADAELLQGECGAAWEHITAAAEYVSTLGPDHYLIGQRVQAETNIQDRCGPPPGV